MALDVYTLADLVQELRTVTNECQDPQDIITRVRPCAPPPMPYPSN